MKFAMRTVFAFDIKKKKACVTHWKIIPQKMTHSRGGKNRVQKWAGHVTGSIKRNLSGVQGQTILFAN